MSYVTAQGYNGVEITDFFRQEFDGENGRVISGSYEQQPPGRLHKCCWYGVYELRRDPVTGAALEKPFNLALICLCDNVRREDGQTLCADDFGYKDMEEGEMPYYYDMPPHLFDQLSPIEDCPLPQQWKTYAANWRKCVQNNTKYVYAGVMA